MHPVGFFLPSYKTIEMLDVEAGRVTVLFGKNNAGKSNMLQAIANILDEPGTKHLGYELNQIPRGALTVQLGDGHKFDNAVRDAFTVAGFDVDASGSTVTFTNRGAFLGHYTRYDDGVEGPGILDAELLEAVSVDAPEPRILTLNWDHGELQQRVEAKIAALANSRLANPRQDWPWLEGFGSANGYAYRIPEETKRRVGQLASLASDLLPDFIDGTIDAHVPVATLWGVMPKVRLEFKERNLGHCADLLGVAGEGYARWMAAAVELALDVMVDYPDLQTIREVEDGEFSGRILLLDEPEAHLHSSAVASMVRWCKRVSRYGFSVVVASHHEEFLRAASDDIQLVQVTRSPSDDHTAARAIPLNTSSHLLDLATHVGMSPAAALSIRKAILFVEGPLDEAVLDEYAGTRLDLAGITIIPIHGTKNIEGIVSAQLTIGLGVKIGILTDATDTSTIHDRSNKKRSSEEKKVLRVIDLAVDRGLPPPRAFGVVEDDLLFTLPPKALSDVYLNGAFFPLWKDLVTECRDSLGALPSQSVDWKKYAKDQYGLPITTPEDVRHIVFTLDVNGIELPSITKVIDEVIQWVSETSGNHADDKSPI